MPSGAVLPMTFTVLGAITVMSKGVLKPGSSKDGKQRRASVDSNWVKA